MVITLSILSAACLLAIAYAIASGSRSSALLASKEAELTEVRIENARLAERIERDEASRDARAAAEEDRFRALAAAILNENSELLRRQHSDKLSELINPLSTQIDSFRKAVDESYNTERREQFALKKQIEELMTRTMLVGREADRLSTVLSGNTRSQGQWGEIVLETILTNSGLQEGREYRSQYHTASTDDSERGKKPDVVVFYPDDRCVVIDSKVSLTDYIKSLEATNDAAREAAIKAHVRSVKAHVRELKEKSYHEIVAGRTVDFTIMFMPNEPAYIEAMRADSSLWEEAYNSQVVIASPTHLISMLKLIRLVWLQESQSRNAQNIAKAAGAMLDKFTNFVASMDAVGSALKKATEKHDEAMKQLSFGKGNLIRQATNLKELGVNTKKDLPTPSDEAS